MEESALIDKLLGNEHIDLSSHTFYDCFNDDVKQLFFDEETSEIMINNGNIYIEKKGCVNKVGLSISDEQTQRFLDVVSRSNSRNIDLNHPIFDGSLLGGFRCNVVIPPISLSGTIITIRKHSNTIRSISELVQRGMMTNEHALILKKAIADKENIIIAGGTGTGKTTLVNVMFNGLSCDSLDRIITIEDTAEIRLELPHVISLESRFATPDCPVEIGIRDLVKTALRMRPDRIIIGEVRGEEAYDLLHAMNTGHKGTVCTIHANSCRDALRRLETLAILGHANLDILVPRSWIASNVGLIIYVERVGSKRLLKELKRIEGVEGGNYVLCDLIQGCYT